ncbi:MAG: hypothetical protein R2991_11005 [Thermoanaerobaculia bacterium]
MKAVHVRNVPTAVVEALKRRASRHERSLEGELRHLLREVAELEMPAPGRSPVRLHLSDAPDGPPWDRQSIYGDDGR